jgi:hypothetical protein
MRFILNLKKLLKKNAGFSDCSRIPAFYVLFKIGLINRGYIPTDICNEAFLLLHHLYRRQRFQLQDSI